MNKQELYDFLNLKGVSFEKVEHHAVFTVEEADALNLPHPEAGAKNLFLRDDKKKHYYILTVRDRLSVNLKEFQEKIGSRKLSFASEADLLEIMGLTKGSVTPFGVLNDVNRRVEVYLDSYYNGRLISVHPNENTATVYLNTDDLVKLIREHSNPVEFIDLEH